MMEICVFCNKLLMIFFAIFIGIFPIGKIGFYAVLSVFGWLWVGLGLF